MKTLHKWEHPIRFEEVDRQGIMFYARTFPLAHACLEDFCRRADFGYEYWFVNPEFAVPIKQTVCEYSKPIRLNDTLRIEMSLLKSSTSAITFAFDFYVFTKSGELDSLCARVESTHVFVDQKTFQKIPLPLKIRKALGIDSPGIEPFKE